MKKLVCLLLSVMLVATCACAFAYEAGTYTASAKGNNGDVTVSVTFSADAITEIVIGDNLETESLAATLFERIPKAIVEGQTLAVDTITGATNSSNAVLTAVADCVAQAGGDVEALKAAVVKEEVALEQKELRTQLLVIGGGTSGLSAAVTAANAGVETLLIEKNPNLGGAGALSAGAVLVTGTEIQKAQGVADDTPELMIEDFLKNGDNMNNMTMLTLYANNVAQTVEWMMNDLGLEFQDGLAYQAEYQKDRVLYPVGAATGLTEKLVAELNAGTAKTMLETRAYELLTEGGKVIGAKATGVDAEYTIYADAVILATGGYGYAKDLLPEALQKLLYYGPSFLTGDGQKMAMAVNAQFDLFDLGKIYPNGVEVAPGAAKSTIWANAAAFAVSAIMVNPQGERIANEKASNNDLKAILMEQPNNIMYMLMDAASFAAFRAKVGETGISDAEIETWLANNGSSAPLFAYADTIEEVAAIAGIDAEGLKATIEKYNGFVRNGKDEDFDRPAQFMTTEIGEGPYYIVEQKPRFATTMGGVVLNENMQVYDNDGNIIEGLYACGEMANLVHGSNSPIGANVSWALTSGHVAAQKVAENVLAK